MLRLLVRLPDDAFSCPVCLAVPAGPVVTDACGHTVCETCRDALHGRSCPLCRAPLHADARPDLALSALCCTRRGTDDGDIPAAEPLEPDSCLPDAPDAEESLAGRPWQARGDPDPHVWLTPGTDPIFLLTCGRAYARLLPRALIRLMPRALRLRASLARDVVVVCALVDTVEDHPHCVQLARLALDDGTPVLVGLEADRPQLAQLRRADGTLANEDGTCAQRVSQRLKDVLVWRADLRDTHLVLFDSRRARFPDLVWLWYRRR